MFKRWPFMSSKLYDQDTFYPAFVKDLSRARRQVIIECPFITLKRIKNLMPLLVKLRKHNVEILINTRNPLEHDGDYERQALEAVTLFQDLGITVLYTQGHHRKLAIIDGRIVWEGSLNILSFNNSCEIMRKITSQDEARTLIRFINLEKFIGSTL